MLWIQATACFSVGHTNNVKIWTKISDKMHVFTTEN
jgi:hypothetical protein